MKRLLASAAGLAVILGLLFLPALFWGGGGGDDTGTEQTRITDYVADFRLADDGDLAVVEELTVDFPVSDLHGIFRFWDRVDSSAPHARRTPHSIEVEMDGRAVTWERLEEEQGRYVVAKIGDPAVTVDPGRHVYRISYVIDGVVEPGSEDAGSTSQFYWNLVPGGWRQAIDRARLTVHLPVPASGVRCAVGAGETTGCRVQGDGTDTLTVEAGPLPPRTPVTVKVGLDLPTPARGEERPWSARFDRVLGPGWVVLGLVLLLAVAAGVGGVLLSRRARETDPGFPLMYAPPEGIGPAQAKYLLREGLDDEDYVATLMYAAEKGAVTLDKSGEAWVITDKAGAEGWAKVDPVTAEVAHLLSGPGTSFVAHKRDVEAGRRIKSERDSFNSSVESWARGEGLLVTSGLGGAGSTVFLLALAAVGAVLLWNPFSMTMVGLIPGAFAVGAAPLVRRGSGTRRTRAGRDLWARVGGFERVLSTPSSRQRFDFSGRQDLYTAYIPWAVAFGCAEEWAEKYRTEMGAEPPRPSYFGPGYAGWGTGAAIGSVVDDFGSTVSGAVSAYQATQRSSSSGGGGFSGGGGGGGGGGGSW